MQKKVKFQQSDKEILMIVTHMHNKYYYTKL